LTAFTILLEEQLLNFADHSESIQSGTGSLGPVGGGRRRHSMETISGELESEGTHSHCYPCGATRFAYYERFLDRDRSDIDQSEEEEVEAYASSMDSSMGVYYPRHLMGVR
jgi:hypothetical protein